MPEGDTLHGHARAIHEALAGQVLVRATSTRVDLARLTGRTLVGARAQGKHLLIDIDSGHVLRTHLRMHGVIRVRNEGYVGAIVNPHVRWLLASENATALCLDAPTVELFHASELSSHPVLSQLGPDLLGESLDTGEALARLRRDPDLEIGTALMDQEKLSGIGNVYKSEVLFITETSPLSRLSDLDDARLIRIIETARSLMQRNVGGARRTTPRGRIAGRYFVYGRSGELCMRCGERIGMIRQGPLARSTYFCSGCQPLPARSPA